MFVLLLWQLLPEIFLILERSQRDTVINAHRSARTVSVILVRFSHNLNFLDRFSKNNQISNFTKIRPVGAEVFHADGRTDMTQLTAIFRNSTNAM